MTKIIIIFGLVLVLFAGFVFYQFANPLQPQTKKITINGHTFTAEVAQTAKAQQIGLTKYDSLPVEKGMLFPFAKAGEYAFWMRDMKFPIDLLFIKENTIVAVIENAPPAKASDTNIPTYGEDITSDAVLEITAGLSKKYEIKQGDKIVIK